MMNVENADGAAGMMGSSRLQAAECTGVQSTANVNEHGRNGLQGDAPPKSPTDGALERTGANREQDAPDSSEEPEMRAERCRQCATHHACDCLAADAGSARALTDFFGDDAIPRAADLLLWAQTYGDPEEWVKRAQAAHLRAEKAEELLLKITDLHHRTIAPSRMHDPERQSVANCPALTCEAVARLLPAQVRELRAGEAANG